MFCFQPVEKSILHLAFTSFTLFQEHTLTIKVRDYTATTNFTVVTNTTVTLATGEVIPDDVMVDMDTTGNVTSRDVIVEFSSMFDGETDLAQVAAGFQMKYQYLDSGKNPSAKTRSRCTKMKTNSQLKKTTKNKQKQIKHGTFTKIKITKKENVKQTGGFVLLLCQNVYTVKN